MSKLPSIKTKETSPKTILKTTTKNFGQQENLNIKKLDEVVVALSGGGARGAIHLGVLQAFDDHNISVKAISGSSIGSIIGALYCAGYSPLKIKSFMNSKAFLKVFSLSIKKQGLLQMNKLIKLLSSFIPENDFNTLKIPFYSCVSNLEGGYFEILSQGNLYKSIVASASIPIIFEPVLINDQYYIDGGLFNNLPVEPLLSLTNIVGVHVNNYKPSDEMNMASSAEKIFTHVIRSNVKPQLEKCDFVIEPYISKHIGVLDFSQTNFLFDLGYKSGLDLIENNNKPKVQ